jgi:UDPglucose 6-dehydrogenase
VFRNPNFEKIEQLLIDKVIFDGRNLYELSLMKEKGFHYESIGRKMITKR